MTDRLKALIVVLEDDLRTDDAKGLIDAIKLLRGVADVGGNVRSVDDFTNRSRIRGELAGRLWAVLKPGDDG